ncbi:hypothetical protein BDV12DRAFT_196901 [Aspergillus spectabilis]
MQLWFKACTFALLAQHALAYPRPPLIFDNVPDASTNLALTKREILKGRSLRILPLGASITNGEGSSDQNGYRKHLRDALRWAQVEVDMVGSKQTGTNFNDNDNEDHGGFTIEEVHKKAESQYRVMPNLVLINAGTNDCRLHNFDAYRYGATWMKELVVDIFDHIPEWITLAEIPDGTHPNDKGYEKLAAIWFDAIVRAWEKDFITNPLDNGLQPGGAVAVCDKKPGEFNLFTQIQQGSGADDGPYKHKGVAQGSQAEFCSIEKEYVADTILWADLNGDGLYRSNPDAGRSQTHVRLGDIDGDGRLDYCLIADNGDISCWRNGWIKPKAGYWQALGVVFTGKNKGNIDGVQLVDINGDHRADWLYVNDNGYVCYKVIKTLAITCST